MSPTMIMLYFASIILSPFIGVIIAYVMGKKHQEIGMLMCIGAFLCMGAVALGFPFMALVIGG